MSIPEKLEFINEIFISDTFRLLCESVDIFRAFLQETKPAFERARTYASCERSKQKLFLLNRIFEIRLNKANVFRDEFVQPFNELQDIFLNILDIDFNRNIEKGEILIKSFFLAVNKLIKLLNNFRNLKMYRARDDFSRLFLDVFVNYEEECLLEPISLIVKGNLMFLDELLSNIKINITGFIAKALCINN